MAGAEAWGEGRKVAAKEEEEEGAAIEGEAEEGDAKEEEGEGEEEGKDCERPHKWWWKGKLAGKSQERVLDRWKGFHASSTQPLLIKIKSVGEPVPVIIYIQMNIQSFWQDS